MCPHGGIYESTGRIVVGQQFQIGGHLPVISNPKYINVASDHLRIDDWIVPYHHITKTTLQNLHKSWEQWATNPESGISSEMGEAVIERFQERLEDWSA